MMMYLQFWHDILQVLNTFLMISDRELFFCLLYLTVCLFLSIVVSSWIVWCFSFVGVDGRNISGDDDGKGSETVCWWTSQSLELKCFFDFCLAWSWNLKVWYSCFYNKWSKRFNKQSFVVIGSDFFSYSSSVSDSSESESNFKVA